jgi:hypothetical protein
MGGSTIPLSARNEDDDVSMRDVDSEIVDISSSSAGRPVAASSVRLLFAKSKGNSAVSKLI